MAAMVWLIFLAFVAVFAPVNKNCAVMQAHEADKAVTTTHNGKTYAFCCEDCIDTFKKDPAKYSNAK